MVGNVSMANTEHHMDGLSQIEYSKLYDDDGRPKRKGTIWTSSSHIITAVIGAGVLSLSWSISQLGWIGGLLVMILFSVVTLYTSSFLADCYRVGDPNFGKRNYSYTEAVRNILGGYNETICGMVQHSNLYATAIGYTIAASISMRAITITNYIHSGKESSHVSINPYMLGFGAIQIIMSQIPDFHNTWLLSVVAAIMSFTYSLIGLGLAITKFAETGTFKGTLTGISIGTVTKAQKVWGIFQALGNIAFAYSYSMILIEIQDTLRSPPSEVKTMKKSAWISILVTTTFYMLCGCMGYAAFGNTTPGNLLSGFNSPYWLINIANVALVIHLVGAYQVYAQPLFAFIETWAAKKWPNTNMGFKLSIPGFPQYNLSPFRLIWRTLFVITTTFIAMLIPFFNDVLGVIGALGFWPLTVYYPVEMYIKQKRIPKWSGRWICLQLMSVVCLLVTIVAAIGSVIGVVLDLKKYKPFTIDY